MSVTIFCKMDDYYYTRISPSTKGCALEVDPVIICIFPPWIYAIRIDGD